MFEAASTSNQPFIVTIPLESVPPGAVLRLLGNIQAVGARLYFGIRTPGRSDLYNIPVPLQNELKPIPVLPPLPFEDGQQYELFFYVPQGPVKIRFQNTGGLRLYPIHPVSPLRRYGSISR